MTGVLICGGMISNYLACKGILPEKDVIIICADGGARHIQQLQLIPDLIMGDMDSIEPTLLIEMKKTIKIEVFAPEKDLTDSELVALKAVEMGCTSLIFLAAWGSRMDHTLANIMLMERLAFDGRDCVMTDGVNFIYSVSKKITLDRKNASAMVSLLPSTPIVKGVSTRGLQYSIKQKDMRRGENIGVSNYIIDENAEISIEEGILLVVLSPKD